MAFPIISVAQMREWEKVTWASGQTEEVVIKRAGLAVAKFAERVTREGDVILVLAGKGHNGDDARLAARQINGRSVELIGVSHPDPILKDLEFKLEEQPSLIIDGLFGIGLNRSLSEPWIQLIRLLNESGIPILAVDIPSGLHAEMGVPLDEAIRATWTLTMGAVKQGLVQSAAWTFVGRLEVAGDVGLVSYPFETEGNYVAPGDFSHYPPVRGVASHKGTYGHLMIVAGSLGYHGAAVLAARGAQRAQPGLITVMTSERTYGPVASQLQGVMVRPGTEPVALPEKCTCLLVGPGLASSDVTESLKKQVRLWWQEAPMPMVVDASALDWIPAGYCKKGVTRVLTPHPGEAARLNKSTVREVQNDRMKALREISASWGGSRVVLKGHQTLSGHHKEGIYMNCSGNPYLAQGGSGDLLAGYMAGLLAQPALQDDPALAIRYAVWRHGAAADELTSSQGNWTVEDLAARLGAIRPASGA